MVLRLVESLPMIVPILLDFDTSLAQVMPPILHLRNLLSSTAMPVFDVKITVLEVETTHDTFFH